MGGDTSPVNILSDPGAWILFVSVLFLAEYIIILRLCYTLCDFVACNKSHAINAYCIIDIRGDFCRVR